MTGIRREKFIERVIDQIGVIGVNIAVGIMSREHRWLGKGWAEDAFREAKDEGKVSLATRMSILFMGKEERTEGFEGIKEGVRVHQSLERLKSYKEGEN